MSKQKVEFVSVWDGGATQLASPAEYNPATGEVTVLEFHDGDEVNSLDREFIVLPDGTELVIDEDRRSHTGRCFVK